ncbi:MAG: AbrB/MazE/SpoVT family DNA-binding domain-containing protein [Nitrospirae bacterium]|nr:MAG: AbrB/MazE/SpoVT family DNA-binding domain-containing protein [Nitrospirota bacterium]
MLCKKTSKNQLTLPKDIVEKFKGVEYFDVVAKGDRIILTPVKIVPAKDTLKEIREKVRKLGLTEKDVEKAIRWARKKS